MSSDSGATANAQLRMPRKSGHVYKRSGVVRSWKLLFFSLEGSVLYYFKHEGDASPKGVVVLSGCDVRVTRDKKLYSFRISHPKTSKVYELATTLPSRTEDWIAELRAAAAFVPNSTMLTRSESTASSDGSRDRTLSRATAHSSSSHNLRASVLGLNPVDLDAIRARDDSAPLPEQHRARMELLMADFVVQARADAPGWKLQTEKLGVKAYVRTASKLGSFKGVGEIQQHPFVVLQLILEIAQRHVYDPQLLAKQRVHVFDQHSFIDHLVYKAVFPAAPREFVNLTHWRVLEDNSILVVAAAIERDDLVPRREPKVVRGEVIMAGFLLVPSADYSSVTATYITKADVKSGIPQAMQTKLFLKQAFLIAGLRRALEDDDDSEQRKTMATYPRVTNATDFGLDVTEPDHDDDDDVHSVHSDDQDDHAPSIDDEPESEFGSPSVPTEFRDLIEKAIARMDAELDDASAWTFHSEKSGVKSFTKVDGSLTASKGEGYLPFHPRLIWDAAINTAERTRVDPQLASGKTLKRLDAQTVIEHLEYKAVFVVAGRDFCNLAHWRVLPNGTIVVIAQSIEDLALCPLKEPKVVRGEVHLACWKIVPNDSYTGAQVSYMAKSDLKGNIPARLAGKVAAEQPFILLRISDMLKKMKDTDAITAQGKLVNTGSAPSMKQRSSSRSSTSSRQTSKSVSLSSQRSATSSTASSSGGSSGRSEPEPEVRVSRAASSSKTKSATAKTVAKAAPSTSHPPRPAPTPESNTPEVLAALGAQCVVAYLALRFVALPSVLHYGAVLFVLVWAAVQLHLGPSNMSPRRKLMIASFGPPDSGMILGTLEMDVSKANAYIAAKRQATGDHITITHLVLRAIGAALGDAPSVNGHIVFGNYYPAPTVDISCLVAVDGGKDLGVCRLPAVDTMSLQTICSRVRGDATKLRSGKDKAQEDRNQLLRMLPTFIVRPVVNFVGWLGGAVGIRVPPVGVERYMFGVCMVTSVGMMGLDLAFAPLTPYAQTPMLVTVGAIKEKPVVVDGQIVVRPMLTVTTTIDHRYVDGSEAARMANSMKRYIEDPNVLEPLA